MKTIIAILIFLLMPVVGAAQLSPEFINQAVTLQIKTEADNRILEQYSDKVQRRSMARAVELIVNWIETGSWTVDEQAEIDRLRAVFEWTRAMRQAAADAIASLDTMTDLEKAEFDPRTEINWPVPPAPQ